MPRTPRLSRLWLPCIALLAIACAAIPAQAQSGLRDALEKLDANQNGMIEPDEITPLARPYFEMLSKRRETRLRIEQPNQISRIQEAARIYYALQNGVSGENVTVQSQPTVLPFGTKPGEPLVPEFGLAEYKLPYTQADLDFADRTFRTHDENKDGYIDRHEASRNKWTHRNPFDDDLNHDNRMSRLEMAQRYARRRLLEKSSDQLRKNYERKGGLASSIPKSKPGEDRSQWWRKGGSDYWLTAALMGRFDSNKNKTLEKEEAERIGIPMVLIDPDRNGIVTREELFGYMLAQQEALGSSDSDAPARFYEKDLNRDGQVSMDEFAEELTNESLEQFGARDRNSDGLLTETEVTNPVEIEQNEYANREVEMLPPRKIIISEIEVSDDFEIGDLNVQINLSHSHVSYLDAYFVGPDGERIELFTAIGGGDDFFDNTIFDDEAEMSIVRAKPPYSGSFAPEAINKKQLGLSQFNGKSSKGLWQLIIRGTRSNRPGLLHSWKLLMQKKSDQPAEVVEVVTE